jgi:hypothetical protein
MTLLRGEIEVTLHGGPFDGWVLSTMGPAPLTAALGDQRGFVYRLSKLDKTGGDYEYAPELSEAHDACVRADAEAIEDVARAEGVSPEEILARAAAMKLAAKGKPHPAQMLLAEAERLGVPPETLLVEKGLIGNA